MNRKIEDIIEYIKNNYDNEACGYTEERSEGNCTDVFNDGCECGRADTLYAIGQMLGIELEEPEEQKYSWEE